MSSRKVYSIEIDNVRMFTSHNWVDTRDLKSDNLPTLEALNALKEDDRVKICDGLERFYVLVDEVEKKGNTVVAVGAVITTNLLYSKAYNYGDIVIFQPENVYEIITKETFDQRVKEYEDNYTPEQLAEKFDKMEKVKYVKHDEI